MAVCTKGVKVMIGDAAGATFKPVCGVTDIPALGASPEKIDVTTLADESRKYINGIKDYGDLEFSCIFEEKAPADSLEKYGDAAPLLYADLRAYEVANAEHTIKVVVPASEKGGEDLEIEFKGRIAVAMAEFAVNAAITFTLSVALSSEITSSVDGK